MLHARAGIVVTLFAFDVPEGPRVRLVATFEDGDAKRARASPLVDLSKSRL